jgi:hypothetical protein
MEKQFCSHCDDYAAFEYRTHSTRIDGEIFTTEVEFCKQCGCCVLTSEYRQQREDWLRKLGKDPVEIAEKEMDRYLNNL